ncbi:hypothetical protein QR680_002795 [Steinernema hermaphroditum]|uniref:3'-phosphate/5'-hydroxy nucleic acid ligase n=1 Tax=Steinernema hermaphroditum TaxID=289476 RepID=A0AA39H4Z9_9BILA|nr:hypothetical protein QR680_002795 [Steinernema hermaphroditum]
MIKCRQLLGNQEDFFVPGVFRELPTKRVLATEFIEGKPVDKCMEESQVEVNGIVPVGHEVVDEVYDEYAAAKMGIDHVGQVCVMLHCGSRGLGHQVATDSLVSMEKAIARDNIRVNDRQVACARINSQEGKGNV